ncbi:MAG: NUDIX domain-containing protein [Candidatus Bathyarchaeia archaeon]|nr:NUDIX domain-containing protein [Candidatus Bathyarchaeota archaeon]
MGYETLTSAGGVVFRRSPMGPLFLLLRLKRRSIWCLPKGLIEDGESELEAAKREVGEETGIDDLRLIDEIGTINYEFWMHGKHYRKTVYFFLFETEKEDAKVSWEHDACRWFSFEEAFKALSYPKEKEILRRGYKIIKNIGI